MPFLLDGLEIRRTPSELLSFVEKVHQDVRENRVAFEAGMKKRGRYKEFLDEVQPLCAFSSATYPENFTVQPVLGNQGYDAIVFDSKGQQFERLEFARPYDGESVAKAARQVVSDGHSALEVRDLTDPLGSFIPYIRATAKAKSEKDYRGITIVFILAVPPPIAGTELFFAIQVSEIVEIIKRNLFNAAKVLLFIPTNQTIVIA